MMLPLAMCAAERMLVVPAGVISSVPIGEPLAMAALVAGSWAEAEAVFADVPVLAAVVSVAMEESFKLLSFT